MKFGITSDLHLNSKYPERLENLNNLITDFTLVGINTLIIAGDLLDRDYHGYKELDQVMGKFPEFNIYSIPGNHDRNLEQKFFNSKNIRIYNKTTIDTIGGQKILFIPYHDNKTMGEIIETIASELDSNWIMISHGDFGIKNRADCGNEDGYFPLTAGDIIMYSPSLVILGHIHKPGNPSQSVIYPGSPYPLDITETGQRRVLIYDTDTGAYESHYCKNIPVYLILDIFLIPDGNENKQITSSIENFINNEKQNFNGNNFNENLTIRVRVNGYTSSMQGIKDIIENTLNVKKIRIEKIDLEQLKVSNDEGLNEIASSVGERIEKMQISYNNIERLKKITTHFAYEIIYGKQV